MVEKAGHGTGIRRLRIERMKPRAREGEGNEEGNEQHVEEQPDQQPGVFITDQVEPDE